MMVTRNIVLLALGASVITACSDSGGGGTPTNGDSGVPVEAATVRVLTANIGNPDTKEEHYPLRLSYQSYEDYVGQRIRELAPDIVFLQEVLPPETCAAFTETDPKRTCYQASTRKTPVERILGSDYTIVCDARLHVECIGVRTSFGTIDGLSAGAFQLSGAETPPLPLPTCSYFAGNCSNEACDAEATISAVTVTSRGKKIRVVHAHPNAPGESKAGFYTGEPCRYQELVDMFEGASPLVGNVGTTLAGGDFNMDPDSFASDREKALWSRHVGTGKRFTAFGPPRGADGAYYPTRLFAVDHVIGEGFTGSCRVMARTYDEEDPKMMPSLDNGYDFSQLPSGPFSSARIDHSSIFCELRLNP